MIYGLINAKAKDGFNFACHKLIKEACIVRCDDQGCGVQSWQSWYRDLSSDCTILNATLTLPLRVRRESTLAIHIASGEAVALKGEKK